MIYTAAHTQHLTYFDQPTIQHPVCSEIIVELLSTERLIKQALFPALDSFRTIQCWKYVKLL